MVNINILNSKLFNFENLSIKEKYIISKKVFDTLNNSDKEALISILDNSGISSLYKRALSIVSFNIKKNMVIVPEFYIRNISLLFNDSSLDKTGDFFEIVDLAKKMSKDILTQSIIIGFFMDEEKMTVIQSYFLLNPEIKGIIYG